MMFPTVGASDLHSWRVGLDVPPDTFASLSATLSPDERIRSERLRFEHDRRRFVVARGVLRDLLGRYLGTAPDHVRFVYNAFGKPELGPEFGGRLTFNLSHSADLALVAVAAGAAVGVDLEYIRGLPDHAEIARRSFSAAEVEHLNSLPSHLHAEAFFSYWTRKEAYAKARGEGLTVPSAAPGAGWSFYTVQPAPGYIGALAIEGGGWRLSQRHWQASSIPAAALEARC